MAEITDPALLAELGRGAPSAPRGGAILRKPGDPTAPLDVTLKGQQIAKGSRDAGLDARLDPLKVRQAELAIRNAELATEKAERELKTGGAKGDAKTASLNALVEQINRVQELYEANIAPTSGLSGALDFLPTEANSQFNAAGAGLAEQGLAAFRVPGVGSQSDTELRQFVEANRPQTSDFDLRIEEKLRQLRNRVDATRSSMGLDAANWVFDGKPQHRDDAALGANTQAPGGAPPSGLDRSSRLLGGGEADGVTLARKGQRFATDTDKRFHGLIQTMLDNGASVQEANDMAARFNYKGQGGRPIFDAKEWAAAQRYNATVRDGQPRATVTTPETGVSDPTLLNSAMSSPFGALAGGYLNGVTMGGFDEAAGAADSLFTGRPMDEAIAEANLKKGLIGDEHPKTNFAGNLLGGATSFIGGNMLASKLLPGAVAKLGKFAPAVGDTIYGGTFGALEDNDNRLGGAAKGAGLAVGGGMLGRTAGRGAGALARTNTAQGAMNTVRGIMGRPLLSAPLRPGAADRATLGAINKGGVDDITAQLQEAQGLGIPMTLADTHPELRSLAGASVRRSPTASLHAENTLIPRSRGQIDRFGQAVERDLGPVANIPQLSDDLIKQAKENAGPLYQTAYAAPPISTPELSSVLETPFARSALGRAHGIAANERRDPAALGFTLDSNGSVVLNPVAADAHGALAAARSEFDEANRALTSAKSRSSGSGAGKVGAAEARVAAASQKLQSAQDALAAQPTAGMAATSPGFTPQTLDYVKRGMDDVLEVYRNPITRRLDLDEAGKAQNAVRSQFLKEVDRVNPAYADARAAYAGPAGEKEALYAGQRAFGTHPDQLGVMLQGQTPERLGQMQLGYRGSLMDAGNRARYSSNPFDATLGTPAAEQRLATMFPENPGVPNLLRQRDIERSLANTTNDILGNSKTAQRGLADQEFGVGDLASTALDVGVNIATGQVPTGLVLKQGAGQAIKDWWKLGIGSKARQKAEDLAPVLLNPNPLANIDEITRLQASSEAFDQFIAGQRRRLARPIGMFGSVAASQGQY